MYAFRSDQTAAIDPEQHLLLHAVWSLLRGCMHKEVLGADRKWEEVGEATEPKPLRVR